jgi:hypothetical protein
MANANISALALNQQNMISPVINGGTLGFSLGVASTQVLPANPQIQKVTFHNPSTVAIYVCQAFDANGNALAPGANPGNWEIFPGATMIFTGNGAGGAWLAAAASGSGNPFTVATSQTV